MEVEQVGLDGEGVGAEGGAVADVGDGFEEVGGVPTLERGDVDAVSGEQFGVGGEVDGGDRVAGAVAAAGGGGAVDGEGAAEQSAGVADIACGDEGADAAGGDGAPRKMRGVIDADGEAEFAAERGEAVDVGFGAVAEAEIFAFVDFDRVEASWRMLRGELAGGASGESSWVKGRTRVTSTPVAARSSSLWGGG